MKFARCGTAAPPAKAAAPSWSDATTAASRRPGPPRPTDDEGIVAQKSQSGAEDRPPPGPRYAQSPLPGPAQNPLPSLFGRHRRQFQALGCARRDSNELPSPPPEPLEGDRPHQRPRGTAIKPLQPSLTRSSGQSWRSGRRKRSASKRRTAPQIRPLLLTHLVIRRGNSLAG